MARMVSELYQALIRAGVDESSAERAANAVATTDDVRALVTKQDLDHGLERMADHVEGQIKDLEVRLVKWVTATTVGTLVLLTAVFGAIVAWTQ